jgi:RNA polymerase sigma-70 factor (ECF subfamily)
MAAGDAEAFATLFRRHQATVYRFSRQMLGSREAAEDVTQDVFIALARSVRRFDPGVGALTTYLYGIARNLILQRHKRSRWQHVGIDVLDADARAVASTVDPTDTVIEAQMQQRLRAAILGLPVHYREVIVLCELNGLSYEEAARIAGCPIGTIRSRLSRAREMLIKRCRPLLNPERDEGKRQRDEGKGQKDEGRKRWVLVAKNNC